MASTLTEKRNAFRALHQDGCFILPNPWDVGSARLLEHLGFQAVASTSSGYAWTQAHADYDLDRDQVLLHLKALVQATDLPVNADYESGFAHDLEALAASVGLAVDAGVAGLSIEDTRADGKPGLYDTQTAVERIQTARSAINKTGEDVILVARTEILLGDPARVSDAIDKLVAFADAGADCLYAPGVVEKADIATMVKAVAPRPLNFLVRRPELTHAEIAGLGVRRISVGGGLARAAWGSVIRMAEAMMKGSFEGLASGVTNAQLNEIFS
jgi:2-methylisocitrate lyase-like PEP mutase family enzyme